MNNSDIDIMLAESGNPCLSILIPTYRYSRGRMQNPLMVEQALRRGKQLLTHSAWPAEKVQAMQSKLDSILSQLDYLRLHEALAIFISPNILKVHVLPFEVIERVILGSTFEIRDLVYINQYLKPYFLIALSKKRVRLFKGSGRDLQEITNTDFPKQYQEEYEYAHPSIGSASSGSLKGFERDKSVMQETRMKGFFRLADNSLDKYLKDDIQLFIAGVHEELTSFQDVSHHAKNVVGQIPGNFDIDAVHPLAESAWTKIRDDISASHKTLVNKLKEEIGRDLVKYGIRDVWKAAMEGKGRLLILEKGYHTMAYHPPLDDSQIALSVPIEPYKIVIDAADDIIKIVKQKGGEIVIVENGQLKEFNRIALQLRYPG